MKKLTIHDVYFHKDIGDRERKINRLYELLEYAEKECDFESAAALRWAIFQLENK